MKDLRERLAVIEDLGAALSIASYDQLTAMPPAGASARATLLGTLSGLLHEHQTTDELEALLDHAAERELDGIDSDLIRVARRDVEKARRVPGELVVEMARAGVEGEQAWESARAGDDFAAFLPHLRRNITLRRRYAECFADVVDEPYDAHLDDFEPGMRTAEVRTAFAPLRQELPGLVAAASAAPAPPLTGPFDVDGQRRACRAVLERVGFDPASWVLGESAHPFSSTLGRGDNRITTRYAPATLDSVLSALHEFGHGLYEAQIDPALARTPLGHGCSMAVHESQSRLWEIFVGMSVPFWRGAWPLLAEPLGGALDDLDPEGLVAALGPVRRSLIRVEADPVSYPLHIVLRFDLEVALLEGALDAADLPGAWRDGMRALLEVEVPDDRRGVLQDVHWAAGAFGYFPTYALGTLLAAQLWEAARRDLPGLDDALEAGELRDLREWLRERVHRHGRRLEPREVIRGALGTDLDPGPYLAYARARASGAPASAGRASE